MTQWIHDNVALLAIVGIAVVVGGISLAAGPKNSSVAVPSPEQPATNTQIAGDTTVLTAKKQDHKVHHANEDNFADLVLNSDVPVLVDFYADWCGPCRMVAPVLEELARETTEARIVKVDVDENPELASRFGISSIPNFKVFRDGQVVGEQVGLANKAQLKTLLGI
jgi:thioredoxin 1